MQRWTLPVIILLVAFLGTTAYLSYQVAVNFISWQSNLHFGDAFSEENYPPDVQQTSELLNDIREDELYTGQADIGAYYIDLLARNSWNYPETSADDLHEAIRVSHEVYRNYEYMRPYLVRWNMYLYYAAGLPAKVEMWQSEAVARDPESIEYVRFIQMGARLLADDIDGARAILEAELGDGVPRPTVAGLAVAGYSMLGEMETAAAYEEMIGQYGIHDEYFKHSYAGFLVEQQRYADALIVLNQLQVDPVKSPHDAQQLALINSALYGINSIEAQEMISLGLASTRRDLTQVDLEAEINAQLYRIEENPIHLTGLTKHYNENPERFNVVYSMLLAALACHEKFERDESGLSDVDENVTDEPEGAELILLEKPLDVWAAEARDSASSDFERQTIAVMSATLKVRPGIAGEYSSVSTDDALLQLMTALGDPKVESSIQSQRIPDYDYFLLDEKVIAAREADPIFDVAVNRVVIDYMNRRREMFNDVVRTEPLPYKIQIGQVQPADQEPHPNNTGSPDE